MGENVQCPTLLRKLRRAGCPTSNVELGKALLGGCQQLVQCAAMGRGDWNRRKLSDGRPVLTRSSLRGGFVHVDRECDSVMGERKFGTMQRLKRGRRAL